jgi:hypothetical protein
MLHYSKLLTFFCFSDKDINKDKEDGDEDGWEQVDVNNDDDDKEIMSKKDSSPSPCMPGKTATTASKKTPPQSVASLEKDIKTMSVAAGPSKFVPFNFNHRYILWVPATTYLDDGSRQVYYNYLVNTQVVENFNVTVTEEGLSLKLQVKIPRAFIDLGARARAEFDVSYANSCVIMSGFRSTVNAIVRTVGPDLTTSGPWGRSIPSHLPAAGTQACRSCGTRATMHYKVS